MQNFIYCTTDSATSLMFTADCRKTFLSVHSKANGNGISSPVFNKCGLRLNTLSDMNVERL